MTISSSPATGSLCPYCRQAVASFSGRRECPHCERLIFSVPCPRCNRPTLNLTLLSRYGKATCFACRTEYSETPGTPAAAETPALAPQTPVPSPHVEASPARMTLTPRTPRQPALPAADEARAVVEQCLLGLERAAQDREMLRAPDLRAVVQRYLDIVQRALALDADMEHGDIQAESLRDPACLDMIVAHCFTPLWPDEAVLLPDAVQAWALAVDDAVRHWQFARRRWLAAYCGLGVIPAVPGITTVTPAWHEVIGEAAVISEVLTPGFLLGGHVLRRARVLAE